MCTCGFSYLPLLPALRNYLSSGAFALMPELLGGHNFHSQHGVFCWDHNSQRIYMAINMDPVSLGSH